MAERDEGAQALLHVRLCQAGDDCHVQFDGVGRVFEQLLDRGIADAEIVDGDSEAGSANRLHNLHGVGAEFGSVGFGQLDFDPARRDAMMCGTLEQVIADAVIRELGGRYVDCQDDLGTEQLDQLGIFGQGTVDDPVVDPGVKPGALGDRE